MGLCIQDRINFIRNRRHVMSTKEEMPVNLKITDEDEEEKADSKEFNDYGEQYNEFRRTQESIKLEGRLLKDFIAIFILMF
jgi:hypothetical protein